MRILHGYWRSSAAYRVRIALGLKKLAWEPRAVNLAAGEQAGLATLNPQALLPVLVEGEVVLTQSLAIIEFLDEMHPEPPLLPADPLGRARTRAAAMVVACDIHPLGNLRTLQYLKRELGQPQDALDAWARHWIGNGLAALEPVAAASGGPFTMGREPTLADVCLVPQLYNARRFRVDLAAFPALLAADAAMGEIEPVRAAHPDAQADAPAAAAV